MDGRCPTRYESNGDTVVDERRIRRGVHQGQPAKRHGQQHAGPGDAHIPADILPAEAVGQCSGPDGTDEQADGRGNSELHPHFLRAHSVYADEERRRPDLQAVVDECAGHRGKRQVTKCSQLRQPCQCFEQRRRPARSWTAFRHSTWSLGHRNANDEGDEEARRSGNDEHRAPIEMRVQPSAEEQTEADADRCGGIEHSQCSAAPPQRIEVGDRRM